MRPTLSVLVVSWNSREQLERTLPATIAELDDEDELIVVDNDSSDDSAELVRSLAPRVRLIESGHNAGFARGCNLGAAEARGDLLVILNPDAAPMAGWGDAIRRPLVEERGWAAWQSLIADHGGERINSAGNPIHFTGLAWAGDHGRPVSVAPGPGEVPTLSGACLAIPIDTWHKVGGLAEDFFLYHEDVDLSLRLRLAGGTIGIEPGAIVDHEYEFGSAEHKWRWLERNRWAILIRNFPTALLVLVAPALLATELALILASIAAGWGRQKMGAYAEIFRWLPRLRRERREVQATRVITTRRFAGSLTYALDSPFIPALARSGPVRLALFAYWSLVKMLLAASSETQSDHRNPPARTARPPRG